MSERSPEDYERALRAVLAITMDSLRGQSPFPAVEPDLRVQVEDIPVDGDPCPDCGVPQYYIDDDGTLPPHDCKPAPEDDPPQVDWSRYPTNGRGPEGESQNSIRVVTIIKGSGDDNDEGPTEDGDPCGDCARPVWYCDDEEQWFHFDPAHQCFLARGKAKYP